uniref:NADH-ubiquinone oxidoreductase chain 3 n=1 Tax=Hemitheconyx caudicinctus TaxID=96741 RepID=I7HFG4_9SAUR|nr:NADH dehydrogenase subunit 3 [Hemitheconyx caudicinctus]BAM34427.1 NADH dehydrogenase subunit 3 [Hemitheconyx caudicinctus]
MVTTTVLITIVALLLMMLSYRLPQNAPNNEKSTPYECGFDPIGSARIPLSLAFFLIAILFLLFDLEIALLLPAPWAMNSPDPTTTTLLASTIIMILALGLAYEWWTGGLNWAE